MIKEVKSLIGRFRLKLRKREVHQLMPQGFHGDQHLINLVDNIVKEGAIHFVETGTNVGSTLHFVANRFPEISCISCEPSDEAYAQAIKNTKNCENVKIHNESSQKFLKRLSKSYQHLFDQKTIFWLDAHGYGFDWPLKAEINFIMKHFQQAYILIDDFKVPHLDAFEYDVYGHYICSLDFIKDAIPKGINYNVYYPNYEEHTSKFHPKRGWGLLVSNVDTKFLESNPKVIEENAIEK